MWAGSSGIGCGTGRARARAARLPAQRAHLLDGAGRALKSELRALEERQAELENTLSVSAVPEPLIHPNLAEVYRRKVAALHGALADPASRDETFDTIRSLIREIRFVPESGELRIEIKGEFGGILSLCVASDARKPGHKGRAFAAAEQIKLVAGRGFEPLTFRL